MTCRLSCLQALHLPTFRSFLAWLVVVFLNGCATAAYQATQAADAPFLQRAQTQQQGGFTVHAAMPDSSETLALTGLDLYAQGIQPIWLEVKNTSQNDARLTLWSIDREYFSPIEVAYKNRKKFSDQGYEDMQRWFYDNSLQRMIPAGQTRSGLVYTHLRPGTKGFNLDIFSNHNATTFTFFLPLPGFVPDFSVVDFATLYGPDEYRELDQSSLKTALEDMPCCATDETGQLDAGPINVVFVGTPLAVRRSLLRGNWQETSMENDMTSKGRSHRFHGRPPDAIFFLDRADGNERMQLNLWMAPWRVGRDSVWMGQVGYRYKDKPAAIALHESGYFDDSKLISQIIKESISADIDSAQRFILQSFWYNHSVLKVGIVSGAVAHTQDEPAMTFDGFAYFTDGSRAVIFLSEDAVALDDATIMYRRDAISSGGSGND